MGKTVYIYGEAESFPNYRRAVEAAGGRAVFGRKRRSLLGDALLLPGGGDLEPWRYGQANAASRNLDPERDEAELALLQDFTAAGKPVLGICESAITTAKFLAPYFSIVSVLDRARKVTEDAVSAYGAEKFCRSIRSTGLSVLDFGQDPERGLEALALEGEKAVREDGAECILLGCAGFVDFAQDLERRLGVPVLEGVTPAVKLAEALVDMGLGTSKASTWGWPEKKQFLGYPLFSETDLMFEED